jgi:hypothetical protein
MLCHMSGECNVVSMPKLYFAKPIQKFGSAILSVRSHKEVDSPMPDLHPEALQMPAFLLFD